MKPEDLYHVGIVVDDLDASLRWFTDTAGYRWCEEYAGDQVVETPAGKITVPMRFAYSMDTPRLEVLQAVQVVVLAQISYVQAVSDYNKAQLRLMVLLGPSGSAPADGNCPNRGPHAQ